MSAKNHESLREQPTNEQKLDQVENLPSLRQQIQRMLGKKIVAIFGQPRVDEARPSGNQVASLGNSAKVATETSAEEAWLSDIRKNNLSNAEALLLYEKIYDVLLEKCQNLIEEGLFVGDKPEDHNNKAYYDYMYDTVYDGKNDKWIFSDDIFSHNDQERLITAYAEGGIVAAKKIMPDIARRIAIGICQSEYAATLQEDTYLRKLRAEYIANSRPPYERPTIAKILWSIDEDFPNSTEARSLLLDEKYIKKIYEIEAPWKIKRLTSEIRKALAKNELQAGTLFKDHFLRKQRIDSIKSKKFQPSALERLIWDMDDSPTLFLDLEDDWKTNPTKRIAKQLQHGNLTDRYYLYLTYGPEIQNKVESRIKTSGLSVAMEKEIQKLSRKINIAIKKGEVSSDELIRDPFLRKRHAIKMIHGWSAWNNPSREQSLTRYLWDLDRIAGPLNSVDARVYINSIRKNNPGIFGYEEEARWLSGGQKGPSPNPNGALTMEINFASQTVKKIEEIKFIEISEAYKVGKKVGDKKIVEILTQQLGLRKPPTIRYSKKNKVDGSYSGFFHRIYLQKDLPDEERVEVIAHEMWHAYQFGKNKNPISEQQSKYREANRMYIDPEDVRGWQDYYAIQLLEVGAMTFGENFASAYLATTTQKSKKSE